MCFFINIFNLLPGFILMLMNAKVFIPLSRMTFSGYLLNPLVVMLITMSCETSFHLDFYTLVLYTSGFYFITYLAALIFMLLFENPIVMFVRKFAE